MQNEHISIIVEFLKQNKAIKKEFKHFMNAFFCNQYKSEIDAIELEIEFEDNPDELELLSFELESLFNTVFDVFGHSVCSVGGLSFVSNGEYSFEFHKWFDNNIMKFSNDGNDNEFKDQFQLVIVPMFSDKFIEKVNTRKNTKKIKRMFKDINNKV